MGEHIISTDGALYYRMDNEWHRLGTVCGMNELTETFCRSNSVPEKYNVWPKGRSYGSLIICKNEPSIVRIDVIVPDKVVEVTIYDGKEHVYKQVCKEPDQFNLRYALALAWVKYKNEEGRFEQTLNCIGLEYYAKFWLDISVELNKEIDRAIKAYKAWLKEESKKQMAEAEHKAIIERRRAKNKKRREKMQAKKREDDINKISEAIKRSK